MKKQSAGILVYRLTNEQLEVLLVHPGGPFFVKKDLGVWSIPKGEFEDGEAALDAAQREFDEEVVVPLLPGHFMELEPVMLKSGKKVFAWAIEQDVDLNDFKSNTFSLEWPMKSGKYQDFPEVDKAEWFTPDKAREKINAGQIPFIDELINKL